jgi:hypothetical protein
MLCRHGGWHTTRGLQVDHDAVMRIDQIKEADHRDFPAVTLCGNADLFLLVFFVGELGLTELHKLLNGKLDHWLDHVPLFGGRLIADQEPLVELVERLLDGVFLAAAHQGFDHCIFDAYATPRRWPHRRA